MQLKQSAPPESEQLHTLYCANRNVKAAIFWTVVNGWITFVAFHPLTSVKSLPSTAGYSLYFDLGFRAFCLIYLLAGVFNKLICPRERVMLAIWASNFSVALLAMLLPIIGISAPTQLSTIKMVLWPFALILSVSMLSTAIQSRRASL